MKKYRLLKSKRLKKYGLTLYRVRAIRSFGDVKKGDLGGYIEKEDNLSHEDACWVYEDGIILSKGIVRHKGVVWGGEVRGGEVRGGEVWGGEVRGGVVRGGEVRGGVVRGGVVRGGVVRGGEVWGGEVWGGVVRGGEVWGGEVRGGVVWGGEVRGGEVRGGEVWGGEVRGGVVRGGEVRGGVVRGGVVRGGVVRGGVFEKSTFQVQGSFHFLNISRPNHIQIGCIEKTFDEWKKEFKKIGKDQDYSKEQIKEYGQYIDMAISFPNQPKKKD